MIKLLSILFTVTLIFFNNQLFASELEYGMGIGVREDQIQWNIAGDIYGQNPNIISELTWTDLRISMINIHLEGYDQANWYYETYYNYGIIYSGSNQDSDYNSDNRQDEFSRSNNNSSSGEVSDFSFAIGYRIGDSNAIGGLSVTPVIGYSRHIQKLEMTDGYQTIDTVSNSTGAFSGLDSSYDTKWQGIWFGLDVGFDLAQNLEIKLGYEYHDADFYAEADWNLRSDLQHPVSYTHEANGAGHVIDFTIQIPFVTWVLGLEAKQSLWEAEPGTITFYSSNGSISTQQLNVVTWESRQLMLNAKFFF